MATESTVGKKFFRVNGVMYELPVPVCDRIEKLEAQVTGYEDDNAAFAMRNAKLERVAEAAESMVKHWRKFHITHPSGYLALVDALAALEADK